MGKPREPGLQKPFFACIGNKIVAGENNRLGAGQDGVKFAHLVALALTMRNLQNIQKKVAKTSVSYLFCDKVIGSSRGLFKSTFFNLAFSTRHVRIVLSFNAVKPSINMQ